MNDPVPLRRFINKMMQANKDTDEIIIVGNNNVDVPNIDDYNDNCFGDRFRSEGRYLCHAFYGYTRKYIYFVHEYDGSHWVESIPRQPTKKCKISIH